MSKGVKFRIKRTYEENEQRVDVGFKANELKFRVFTPDGRPFTLTEAEAQDLSDALDDALCEQEDYPLT